MRNSAKGVLAAGAAVALLVGGGGTLAFWSESSTMGGSVIDSGHLNLTSPSCTDWQLDGGETGSVAYVPGVLLVPGDVLTQTCSYTIEAQGEHLRATVDVSDPTWGVNSDWSASLVVDKTDVRIDGAPTTSFTEANNGDLLTATVTVTFLDSVTGFEDATTALNDLTLTATQIHD